MPTTKTSDKPIKLNTTAYCLLGLIDLKPQSAYDLTKFLERSMLKYSLPRTPSQLHNEPGEAAKLEFKSLLKFYLAGASNPQALRDRIEEIKQQNLQEIRDAHAQISRFTAKGVILKEVAINAALTSRFAVKQIKARLQWVEEMQALLTELSEDTDPERWAIEVYLQSQQELKELMYEYQLDD